METVNRITTIDIENQQSKNEEILENKIRDAISAYNQLPFVNALLFGFTTASTPCYGCQYQAVRNVIVILISFSMILSLTGLLLSIVTIYHTYKLLAESGAEETQLYIIKTHSFRNTARVCTYASFLIFIISFALCPISSFPIGISITLVFIFGVGIIWLIYSFLSLKYNYDYSMMRVSVKLTKSRSKIDKEISNISNDNPLSVKFNSVIKNI